MINCYLQTSKSAMHFSPWSYQATGFPVSLQLLEKPLSQTSCYKTILGVNTSYQKTESTRLSGTFKNKYTAISINCKSALMKVFRDLTDQHLIQNSLPSQALHGRFIKIRHFVNILYTICMDRYYKPIVLHFF